MNAAGFPHYVKCQAALVLAERSSRGGLRLRKLSGPSEASVLVSAAALPNQARCHLLRCREFFPYSREPLWSSQRWLGEIVTSKNPLNDILTSIDELAKRGQITRNRAFGAWFAINFFRARPERG